MQLNDIIDFDRLIRRTPQTPLARSQVAEVYKILAGTHTPTDKIAPQETAPQETAPQATAPQEVAPQQLTPPGTSSEETTAPETSAQEEVSKLNARIRELEIRVVLQLRYQFEIALPGLRISFGLCRKVEESGSRGQT